VVLVLLLELFDQIRNAWKVLVHGFDRKRPAALTDPAPRPQRRAF
jgi:hypothetical protein